MYESLVNQPAARWFFQSEVTTYLLYCEFCELFENNIFTAQLRTAASVFIPVKICWSSTRLQRNNFTSFKTSWRRLAKTFWRRLEDVLEDEKLLRWRRLEDVLKTCLEDVLKTCLEDVLKTYLEDVFKTSRRQTKFLLVISVSNKSKCVSNKSMFHKSVSDKCKMRYLEPNNFDIRLILKHASISILRIKVSEIGQYKRSFK